MCIAQLIKMYALDQKIRDTKSSYLYVVEPNNNNNNKSYKTQPQK